MTTRLKRDVLWLLMVASSVCYGALAFLSHQFDVPVPAGQRPTLMMLGFFFFAFFCYWVALIIAVRLPASRRFALGVFWSSCLLRLAMLPSIPMHEIDIYRYLWDGAVFAEGVSPYRYSPQQVLEAANRPEFAAEEEEFHRLVVLHARSDSLAESLNRIHYNTLPSPYPLVSQAVFAGAAMATPDNSSPYARLLIMKSLLVLFDLATLLVVLRLVREVGLHPGWSLAYGWCPLLMKEIANGGHLDSIAIFFTTLAVWLLVKTLRRPGALKLRSVAGTGSVLALAIGAKLYPVVLMPLFAALWWRQGRKGAFAVGVLAVGAVSLLLLYPLFFADRGMDVAAKPQTAGQQATLQASNNEEADPAAGIRTFLKQWEMNDLIFMLVLENLRSQADIEPYRKPWFVVVPDDWLPELSKPTTFLIARIFTGGAFALLASWLAWRAAGQDDPKEWCRAGMLTLAWFWLTCPTQNPWYWCWVLPLLPFARYRTWHLVGAMTLLYYLRFWLTAHFSEPPVLGTAYDGVHFFYFVISWVEFAPCLIVLAVEYWLARRKKPGAPGTKNRPV
ncbi:MAG: hypothetical protein MI725_00725 [Pirellulales bacterium]|nr:hypothetical protein [Pirellulales bacterium]